MRYAFFDTESSNNFNHISKMCEFGCILADANLNPIMSSGRDMLMNPGRDGKFALLNRKDGRDLVLAHPYEAYYASPIFPAYYDNIRFFLTQKDTMYFLWAGENDIKALHDQFKRYKMREIDYTSVDVQILVRHYLPEHCHKISLESVATSLGIDYSDLTMHRPDHDSILTMRVLKAATELTHKSPMELVEGCPRSVRNSATFIPQLAAARRKKIEKVKHNNAMRPYNERLNALRDREIPEDTPLEKIFSLSKMIKVNVDKTVDLVASWIDKGYYFRHNLLAAYLVAYDEEEAAALSQIIDTSQINILTKEAFDKLVQG